MIVLIGSEKGGTGKTTLATNLAAMRVSSGSDLLLIDTDPQGSASAWAATRSEDENLPRVSSIQKFGKAIASEVKGLATKYDDLLIDTGGRNSIELRAAMTVADLLIIPIQASQFDVWTLGVMDKLVLDATAFNENLTVKVVLTRASTHYAVNETREAQEILEDDFENLTLSKVIIYDRIAYRKAAKAGMSVIELQTEEKASKEVQSLYQEIFNHV